jgi:hypothetical protein
VSSHGLVDVEGWTHTVQCKCSVDVRLAGDHVNGLAGDDVGDVRLAGDDAVDVRLAGDVVDRLAGDDEVLDDEVEEVDGEGGVDGVATSRACRRCVYVW